MPLCKGIPNQAHAIEFNQTRYCVRALYNPVNQVIECMLLSLLGLWCHAFILLGRCIAIVSAQPMTFTERLPASMPRKKARAKSHNGASVEAVSQVLLRWLPLAKLDDARGSHLDGSIFLWEMCMKLHQHTKGC